MDDDDDDMPLTQPILVRQSAATRSANEIEDMRILMEEEQRNSRNIDNVLSDLRSESSGRNIDNVMSDIRNRTQGGRTRARKNRRTRTKARKNRRTRARKNRRTRSRARARR